MNSHLWFNAVPFGFRIFQLGGDNLGPAPSDACAGDQAGSDFWDGAPPDRGGPSVGPACAAGGGVVVVTTGTIGPGSGAEGICLCMDWAVGGVLSTFHHCSLPGASGGSSVVTLGAVDGGSFFFGVW
jgi:hypothetical protein